jgi:hypothetical protein
LPSVGTKSARSVATPAVVAVKANVAVEFVAVTVRVASTVEPDRNVIVPAAFGVTVAERLTVPPTVAPVAGAAVSVTVVGVGSGSGPVDVAVTTNVTGSSAVPAVYPPIVKAAAPSAVRAAGADVHVMVLPEFVRVAAPTSRVANGTCAPPSTLRSRTPADAESTRTIGSENVRSRSPEWPKKWMPPL